MTFFEKLFTIKNRNSKTENGFKLAFEPVSFRSSIFQLAKDQIRVVLFRECDRRGRKLLFDSNAVEKLPLNSINKEKDFLNKTKYEHTQTTKIIDFVEVTDSHRYRYKKPSNDVTVLGELIFGSVAVVFKGGSTCKIHSLASPRCVVFTNIVHAIGQCHHQGSRDHCSETNSGPDSGNYGEYSQESRICSSDSKLYRHKQTCKQNTSTYPCIKHKSLKLKSSCHCEVNNPSSSSEKLPFFHNCSNVECSEKISVTATNNSEQSSSYSCQEKISEKGNEIGRSCFSEYSELSLHRSKKKSDSHCKCDSLNTFHSLNDFYECKRDVLSSYNSLNSSLGSLRRRWMQSCSSSVEEANFEETVNFKHKTRTKLGIGLIVDLSNNLEDELERFLFNHTIVIEDILKKLQSSIETAYVKKEKFTDIIYTAFINCQQSIYELINGAKYARPMWVTLTETVNEDSTKNTEGGILSQYQENIKDRKKQDTLNNFKMKFLNDFCDVLVKFDTKDTNFFISTLLTAVLTHHLSWVTGIAEWDVSLPQHKLESVIKGLRPYNPIWAQLNDLNGILGSPLKSVRTVVTGCETTKNNIASIIQVLTYFIRCNNVVENVYDFDFEEITKTNQGKEKNTGSFESFKHGPQKKNFTCGADYAEENLDSQESKQSCDWIKVQLPKNDIPHTELVKGDHSMDNVFQKSCSTNGLKKNLTCLFCLDKKDSGTNEETHVKLYPGDYNLVQLEGIHITDSSSGNENKGNQKENCVYGTEYYTEISNLVRITSKSVLCDLDHDSVSKEGCDTVDSSVITGIYQDKVMSQKEKSAHPKDDVLFVLGDNEELVNIKKAETEFGLDLAEEKRDNLSNLWENLFVPKSENNSVTEEAALEKCLTFNNAQDIVGNEILETNTNIQRGCVSNYIFVEKESLISSLHELPMPRPRGPIKDSTKTRLEISSVLGGVNESYNSEQIIQGVLDVKPNWEKTLQNDLSLHAHDHVLDRDVTEVLCIIGDMNSWEVSMISSCNFTMDRSSFTGIRIGMSQLVADMLESLLHIYKIKLPADFCLNHIERKLREIYMKSKSVAELLNSTEVCSIDYLTSRLDISVNDVPLLLSVATTHSPHISSKYGLTYT